jgi:glycerate dehydrogenase
MKKTVILNSAKFNFDWKLDFSELEGVTEITKYDSSSQDEIIKRSEGADVLITKELPLPEDLIRGLPGSVKLICEAGTGYNNIDLPAAKERSITICNVPGYSTGAVAQLAVSFILSLSSSIIQQQIMVKQSRFDNFTKFLQVPHHEVRGKILGVIGTGAIGRQVIRIASALDMQVLYYDINPGNFDESNIKYAPIDTLLRESDFVTLHCPLTEKTRHLIDSNRLKLMKNSAYIINTSRGTLINESDLIEALRKGEIAGAALDVQEIEPPASDNPLFQMENVIITPHIGWQTLESRQRLMEILACNIRAFIDGNPVNVVVNERIIRKE